MPGKIGFPRFLPPDLDKRQRFIVATGILSAGLILTQLVKPQWRFLSTGIFSVSAYIFTAWSLKEDIRGVEWITLFILPVFYTASFLLFYFLLPVRWLTRLPAVILYALGFYALLLCQNIFNVAAQRTIQLLRAASAVGFFLTMVVFFLLVETILSFRLSFWANFLSVFLISLPLVLQNLWSITLGEGISLSIGLYSLAISLSLAEMALFLSFWPVTVTTETLFLTSAVYIFLGMGQYHFSKRLFRRELFQFAIVGTTAFLIMFATAKWGG